MMQTPVGMHSGLHRGHQYSARQRSSSGNTLCICQSLLSGQATHPVNIIHEAPLPQRAQRICRALLVYFTTFLGRKSVMAN